MWKSAIEVRKMAIYDNIVENFEDEESEEAEIEEAEEHQHYGKRSREDDDLPDLKRQEGNTSKPLWNYRNYRKRVGTKGDFWEVDGDQKEQL